MNNAISEFTAFQGAIHDLRNLKQELKQIKFIKLINKYIIKIAQVQIEYNRNQTALHEERLKNKT